MPRYSRSWAFRRVLIRKAVDLSVCLAVSAAGQSALRQVVVVFGPKLSERRMKDEKKSGGEKTEWSFIRCNSKDRIANAVIINSSLCLVRALCFFCNGHFVRWWSAAP